MIRPAVSATVPRRCHAAQVPEPTLSNALVVGPSLLGPFVLSALLVALSCGGGDVAPPPLVAIQDITVDTVSPGLVLPGTTIVVNGSSFVPDFGGPSKLRLTGTFNGEAVDVSLPAAFVDYDRMDVLWPGGGAAGLNGAGVFEGQATIEADSSLDGLLHRSTAVGVTLEFADELAPQIEYVQNEALFVNDPIVVHGDGFLLGGAEGQTVAIMAGCFTPQGGSTCEPIASTEVPCEPFAAYDRTRTAFPFAPAIAGIKPGTFQGTVQLVNRHGDAAGNVERTSGSASTTNDIVEPTIFSFSPATASLGQYVDISGGGFVGGTVDKPTLGVTTIALTGTFTPEGQEATPAQVNLVAEFFSGQVARYVLNEEDELGQAIDLRSVAGTFEGTATPTVQYGADTVVGNATPVTLGLGHVKQVVWLRFLPSYVESLRHFGLRAVDTRVRSRVFEVVERDYAGVNIEFRTEQPTDFALYAEVELGGPDPNGLGLIGYDNTPGKDDGNLRLYDKIGGVNALTQQDGYPGYGGVFVESLFSFSTHPNGLADSNEGADPLFDQLFDPFRPDLSGTPVGVGELSSAATLTSGDVCPSTQRSEQIGCAVWALGSLIGTTLSHEIAHSLGLADPGGFAFHNSGDFPNAIMDAGGARHFPERAEVGDSHGSFCAHNYAYLRKVLPTNEPDPVAVREDCF